MDSLPSISIRLTWPGVDVTQTAQAWVDLGAAVSRGRDKWSAHLAAVSLALKSLGGRVVAMRAHDR